MNKLKLLHTPRPYEDESPGGLLLRFTEFNGWKKPTSLINFVTNFSVIGNSSIESVMVNQKKWNDICSAFRAFDASKLCYKRESTSIRSKVMFCENALPWLALRLKKPAICPLCISEDKYLSSFWDLRIITSCIKHKVDLIDSCPICLCNLDWNRSKIAFCTCGFDLRNSPKIKADIRITAFLINLVKNKETEKLQNIITLFDAYSSFFQLLDEDRSFHELVEMATKSVENPYYTRSILTAYVTKEFNKRGMHPRITLYPFISCNSKQIHKFTEELLAQICLKDIDVGSCNSTKDLKLTEASAVLNLNLTEIQRLMQNKVLSAYISSGKWRISVNSINKLLLIIHYKLKPISASTFPNMNKLIKKTRVRNRDEYPSKIIERMLLNKITFYSDTFLSKGLEGIKIQPKVRHKLDRQYLTIKEVALLCNTHYENIRFAIHAEILKRVYPEKGNGTTILIHRDRAVKFNRDNIFAGTAAKQLNMNPTNIAEKFIELGILPVSGPTIDKGLTYLFKRKDVISLDRKTLMNLKSYSTKTGRKRRNHKDVIDVETLSLVSASNLLDCSIQQSTQLMRKGYLIEFKQNTREKRITRKSFERILEIENNKKLITIREAANAFNQTLSQFIRVWVSTKIIECIDSGLERYIDSSSIRTITQFNEKYILASEAGKLLNTHRSHLANIGKRNAIKPAKTFQSNKNKLHFYRRDEVVALIRNFKEINSSL